ncbi:peroxisomal biogenesis factor 19 [Trichonephila inaurata madagascariensis]|uniref:Peroxisomal biogenesis factor 19 n=1 Tax=Trichonephila inaurata madagascariensis TaxID=2747483 RepID=A0A8X6XPV6_9ARAC|nr:peroxisomal biogenesis factor 19 [Trichonephila inaurata madagascariensis]
MTTSAILNSRDGMISELHQLYIGTTEKGETRSQFINSLNKMEEYEFICLKEELQTGVVQRFTFQYFSTKSCHRKMEQPNKEQPDNDTAAESSGDDLSKLLDSCLDDFNKPLPIPPPASAQSKKVRTSEAKSSSADSAKPPESAAWGEEFKEFSDVMENFITDESELNEIKKLMSSCLSQEGPPIDDENFAKSFADTIQELTQQAQNIPETSPEDLANLLRA